MKKYLWMSSAAVVIGALRVNWNIKSYFLWKKKKNNKKYLWMSSAAVVIGALRVNKNNAFILLLYKLSKLVISIKNN